MLIWQHLAIAPNRLNILLKDNSVVPAFFNFDKLSVNWLWPEGPLTAPHVNKIFNNQTLHCIEISEKKSRKDIRNGFITAFQIYMFPLFTNGFDLLHSTIYFAKVCLFVSLFVCWFVVFLVMRVCCVLFSVIVLSIVAVTYLPDIIYDYKHDQCLSSFWYCFNFLK